MTFIWLVVFGSLMSAMWILTANSFMQHPVGYEVVNGRAQMTDFLALVKIHSSSMNLPMLFLVPLRWVVQWLLVCQPSAS